MGASSSILPATIPIRATEMDVQVVQLLTAVPLLFFGLFIGILLTPIISNQMKALTHLRLALSLQGAGVLGIGLANVINVYWFSAIILGFGFGQLEVLITSAIRRSYQNITKTLTKFGAYLSLSAFFTPLLVIASNYINFLIVIFISVAITSFAVAITINVVDAQESSLPTKLLRIGKRAGFGLCLASASFVGAETILSGWSAVYFAQYFPSITESAPLGTSMFWLFLTLGRFAGVKFQSFSKYPQYTLQIFSTLFAIILLILFILNNQLNGYSFVIIMSLAIFFAGPCYGLIIGNAVSLYDKKLSTKVASIYIVVGAAGGTVIPIGAQFMGNSSISTSILACALAASATAIFVTISLASTPAKESQS